MKFQPCTFIPLTLPTTVTYFCCEPMQRCLVVRCGALSSYNRLLQQWHWLKRTDAIYIAHYALFHHHNKNSWTNRGWREESLWSSSSSSSSLSNRQIHTQRFKSAVVEKHTASDCTSYHRSMQLKIHLDFLTRCLLFAFFTSIVTWWLVMFASCRSFSYVFVVLLFPGTVRIKTMPLSYSCRCPCRVLTDETLNIKSAKNDTHEKPDSGRA